MNEPENLPMGMPPVPAFKNRSTGLTVFGIMTILFGCLAGLFVLLMFVGMLASANNPNLAPGSQSGLLLSALIYGGLAVTLIWLGIGSIMARRWARALLLIFSWALLLMGIFIVAFMGYLLPKVWENMPAVNGEPAMPPGTITVMTIVMVLFMSVFFVLLPAVWIFFYRSPHVKATCEMRDPVMSWTDACPLPVLALSVWLSISGAMLLVMPFVSHGVAPFFGMFLSGIAGSLIYLAVAVVSAFCAWRLYQMDVRGWWIILVVMLLYTASSVMTFARHDLFEMYHLMGYTEAQINQIQKVGVLTKNSSLWMTILSMVPFLGYIVYVKKFLPGSDAPQA